MKKTPLSIAINKVAKSSAIDGHGYDAASKTLAIQFKGGQVHHYTGVPQSVVDGLKKADSAGKFITSNVVGKFKNTPIGGKKP